MIKKMIFDGLQTVVGSPKRKIRLLLDRIELSFLGGVFELLGDHDGLIIQDFHISRVFHNPKRNGSLL